MEKIPKLLCEKSENLAEICGILLGDGSIYVNPKYGIYQVHIAGNSNTDRDYLINYVKPLLEDTFKIKFYIKKQKNKNCIYVWKQSKDLVYTLNHHGLPSGNKVVNNVSIPEWIFSNKRLLRNCIRGLVDTDGCICPKTPRHRYPSIWIKSAIPNLRQNIFKACHILNFHPSKWTEKGTPQCCFGISSEIERYYKEIGFKNPKNIIRWKRYAPIV